jgi:hypothetical protein
MWLYLIKTKDEVLTVFQKSWLKNKQRGTSKYLEAMEVVSIHLLHLRIYVQVKV